MSEEKTTGFDANVMYHVLRLFDCGNVNHHQRSGPSHIIYTKPRD